MLPAGSVAATLQREHRAGAPEQPGADPRIEADERVRARRALGRARFPFRPPWCRAAAGCARRTWTRSRSAFAVQASEHRTRTINPSATSATRYEVRVGDRHPRRLAVDRGDGRARRRGRRSARAARAACRRRRTRPRCRRCRRRADPDWDSAGSCRRCRASSPRRRRCRRRRRSRSPSRSAWSGLASDGQLSSLSNSAVAVACRTRTRCRPRCALSSSCPGLATCRQLSSSHPRGPVLDLVIGPVEDAVAVVVGLAPVPDAVVVGVLLVRGCGSGCRRSRSAGSCRRCP